MYPGVFAARGLSKISGDCVFFVCPTMVTTAVIICRIQNYEPDGLQVLSQQNNTVLRSFKAISLFTWPKESDLETGYKIKQLIDFPVALS